MLFRQLFDAESSTYTYLLADRQTQAAILIDPVLEQVERDLKLLFELDLTLKYCIETHVHADHVTGAGALRTETKCLGLVPAGSHVQQIDKELQDNEILLLGNIHLKTIATPGHTDSHMAYLVNHTQLLTGDALFIRGCGRTDFQGGDPGALFESVSQRLFSLPTSTLVYPGHDYRGNTVSTIGEEKQYNPRFANKDKAAFIELMNNLNLPLPKKMAQAVPANLLGGLQVSV
jgi:sulfur dioxygenase